MLHLYLILAILPAVSIAKVLKEFNNYYPTFYYDNFRCENGKPGAGAHPTTWSDPVVEAYPACKMTDDGGQRQMKDYKSNQMVAIDANLIGGDKAAWCGKKIWKGDGTEYISPGGDLFVWDGCGACTSGPIIDVSDYFAITGVKPGKEGPGNPVLKVQVTDEEIVPFGGNPPDAPGGIDTYTGGPVTPLYPGPAPVCAAPNPPVFAAKEAGATGPNPADAGVTSSTAGIGALVDVEASREAVEPVVSVNSVVPTSAGHAGAAEKATTSIVTTAVVGAQLNAAAAPSVEVADIQTPAAANTGSGESISAAGMRTSVSSLLATGRRGGSRGGWSRPSGRSLVKRRANALDDPPTP